jgi:hypothetical protein
MAEAVVPEDLERTALIVVEVSAMEALTIAPVPSPMGTSQEPDWNCSLERVPFM